MTSTSQPPGQRRSALLGAVAAIVLAGTLAGCGSDEPNCAGVAAGCRDSGPSTSANGCVGEPGKESILQGQPHQLPDGAGVGIGSVDMDADPPTVRLVLGNVPASQRDQDTTVGVGDSLDIGKTTYVVASICSDKVTLDSASPAA
ncbi:MAG TPA: hypothetical protein VH419_07835 [Nocardioidaceae bacterium]|jgi:hypothetical protein